MLNEKEIIELLKTALKNYVNSLQASSFDFSGFGEEAKAYMKVLNNEEFNCEFLSKDKAISLIAKIK